MRRALLCVLLVGGIPMAASAQGLQARGLEAWVGYASWGGEDAESFDPGIQGGLAVLAETAPHFAFGGEVSLGMFDQLGESVTELGVNALFRWSLGPRSGLHAYLQGRVGWSRLAVNALTQDGLALGPELGVEVPVASGVRIVLAGSASWRSYEDARVGSASALLGTGGSGYQYGGRLGIALDDIF